MKRTARFGNKYICPALGPNAIGKVASLSTCDGLFVATVGNVTACDAIIETGSQVCLTDSKPIAHIGTVISYKRTIMSGSQSQKVSPSHSP